MGERRRIIVVYAGDITLILSSVTEIECFLLPYYMLVRMNLIG